MKRLPRTLEQVRILEDGVTVASRPDLILEHFLGLGNAVGRIDMRRQQRARPPAVSSIKYPQRCHLVNACTSPGSSDEHTS